ncbi:MAG: hypothetical protein HeimC3_42040 [Candidatus Heimdallarchaeota archaeon LC_3]|nr:MAG: hypothetical protein HeimC3_42040 [Candidatus Heimdallarchaeota archaeon LC_3]
MSNVVNGIDKEKLVEAVENLKRTPENTIRKKKLTAEWVGGYRAKVYSGDTEVFIGGDKDFGGMSMAQASHLGCMIDVIATHATLRGIELEKLTIESEGEFDMGKYLGVPNKPDPGFQNIECTINIKVKNASTEELEELLNFSKTVSPVGNTLKSQVPINMKYVFE